MPNNEEFNALDIKENQENIHNVPTNIGVQLNGYIYFPYAIINGKVVYRVEGRLNSEGQILIPMNMKPYNIDREHEKLHKEGKLYAEFNFYGAGKKELSVNSLRPSSSKYDHKDIPALSMALGENEIFVYSLDGINKKASPQKKLLNYRMCIIEAISFNMSFYPPNIRPIMYTNNQLKEILEEHKESLERGRSDAEENMVERYNTSYSELPNDLSTYADYKKAVLASFQMPEYTKVTLISYDITFPLLVVDETEKPAAEVDSATQSKFTAAETEQSLKLDL